MPKRGAIALGLTAVALVLLLNFQVPADVATLRSTGAGTGTRGNGASVSGGGTTGGSVGGGSTSGAGTTNGSTGSGSGTTSGATRGTGTVDGPVVDTRYGPVQVEVTLAGGKVTEIVALELPSGGRSGQISTFVEPILRSQALQAQGANIDGVSGATFTSIAYARSLQAALDSAGG